MEIFRSLSPNISQREKDGAAYAYFVRAVGENRHPNVRFLDCADLMPLPNPCDNTTKDHFTLQHTTEFDTFTKLCLS